MQGNVYVCKPLSKEFSIELRDYSDIGCVQRQVSYFDRIRGYTFAVFNLFYSVYFHD